MAHGTALHKNKKQCIWSICATPQQTMAWVPSWQLTINKWSSTSVGNLAPQNMRFWLHEFDQWNNISKQSLKTSQDITIQLIDRQTKKDHAWKFQMGKQSFKRMHAEENKWEEKTKGATQKKREIASRIFVSCCAWCLCLLWNTTRNGVGDYRRRQIVTNMLQRRRRHFPCKHGSAQDRIQIEIRR